MLLPQHNASRSSFVRTFSFFSCFELCCGLVWVFLFWQLLFWQQLWERKMCRQGLNCASLVRIRVEDVFIAASTNGSFEMYAEMLWHYNENSTLLFVVVCFCFFEGEFSFHVVGGNRSSRCSHIESILFADWDPFFFKMTFFKIFVHWLLIFNGIWNNVFRLSFRYQVLLRQIKRSEV